MSDGVLDNSRRTREAISFGTITFLIGIVIASISMFTFMEGRIEKTVKQSMLLAQTQQKVESAEASNQERFKSLKDQIWANKQDTDRTHLEINNKLSTLEARVQSIPMGMSPPTPPPSQ